MSPSHREILWTSNDGKELMRAAQALAVSELAADRVDLLEALRSEDFLGRLDDREAYAGSASDLRLRKVLDALVEELDASRVAVLIGLTTDEVFLDDMSRVELLIEACAALRPSPPEVVDFWLRFSRDEECHFGSVVRAVLENGSEPALEVFRKNLLDPGHDVEDRCAFLYESVVPRRQDVELLRVCRSILESRSDDAIDVPLVEVLFDYRREVWYLPHGAPMPPRRELLSEEAKQELLAIGAFAREQLQLTERLRSRIDAFIERYRDG